MKILNDFNNGDYNTTTPAFTAKFLYDEITALKGRTSNAIGALEKLSRYEYSTTLTASTITDLMLDKNVYLCDCSGGDIIITNLHPAAEIGKEVIFIKTDSSSNKLILKNKQNGGNLIDADYTHDVEILEQHGLVQFINI